MKILRKCISSRAFSEMLTKPTKAKFILKLVFSAFTEAFCHIKHSVTTKELIKTPGFAPLCSFPDNSCREFLSQR